MKSTWWTMPGRSCDWAGAAEQRALGRALVMAWLVISLAGCSTPLRTSTPIPTWTIPGRSLATEQAMPTATGTWIKLPVVLVDPTHTATLPPPPTTTPVPSVRFAVIGDYGLAGQPEADVAALIHTWEVDFVITTGDNNYPSGSQSSIDENIGQYFHEYIYPYTGSYGPGAEQNRFYPSLGNHDWMTLSAQPYLDYFMLPGNERYYDFTWGPLHFMAIDSDSREPDGVGRSSIQAAWLRDTLASSEATWKIVFMHHPPFSSGLHGSIDWMRWPFKEWGASAVLAGHDHTYERLSIDNLLYFVNGLGGGPIYRFENILPESQARFNNDYGAMLVEANSLQIVFQFITRQGEVIDTYLIHSAP